MAGHGAATADVLRIIPAIGAWATVVLSGVNLLHRSRRRDITRVANPRIAFVERGSCGWR